MTMKEKQLYESRIIDLECEITLAIINGHKPKPNDYLDNKRKELSLLRCCIFGFKNPFCRNHFYGDE